MLGTPGRPTSGRLARLKWPAMALVVLAGAAAYVHFGSGGKSSDVHYRGDAASRGDITVIVAATGTVEPTNKVEISSELSDIVRTVAVDFNATVKVGQVLAALDTDKLRATVVQTRQDHQRKQALVEQRVVSSQDLDTARAAYDRAVAALESAKADVDAAEADLRLNETNLEKSCICSPIDGVVLNRR